ncbi:aminotransferase class V-fold PLP-dependent enzyme [Lutibaculum baratangense]|uniref:Cysteine desulfurase n=1 Tax=Lutibaculum baratangense AMV1 TaxID=631454 RepID=V4R2I8_9HYPH|nr:aminotransferase class V-fold PLP-dependent enzyme [Lutibaculum baratangense]ESR26167.1 Cysteine desulfurase [Lutibaculum baratangense AMV1]
MTSLQLTFPAPLPVQRHLFDLPREIAWLNCAYMSPLPRASREAGEKGIRRKSEPWSIAPSDFFSETEEARSLFARLIGAEDGDIAVVPSTSYGIATAARNIGVGKGQTIVVLKDQFPSNVLTWQRKAAACGARLLTVERREDGDWATAILDAIDDTTAVVALPNCHWSDGSVVDLQAVADATHRVGAALVLDLAQSIGAMPIDVLRLKPDYVVAVCYKWMLGPYALGFLYVAPHRQEGEPLEENWIARTRSEDFASLADYSPDYQPGARRFDMGERSSFHLMPVASRPSARSSTGRCRGSPPRSPSVRARSPSARRHSASAPLPRPAARRISWACGGRGAFRRTCSTGCGRPASS